MADSTLLSPTVEEAAAPDPTAPSTAPHNVARARHRRDRALTQEAVDAARVATLRHLVALARQPFREALAELIGGRPTPAAIAAFADKYPDRWAQAVSIMAGLAGYERGVVEVNVLNVGSLSDAQLMQRLGQVERELAAQRRTGGSSGPVEDAEIVGEKVRTGSGGGGDAAPPASRAGGRSQIGNDRSQEGNRLPPEK